MTARIVVLGVHPVEADEPCHLIEIMVEGVENRFDLGEITQEDPIQTRKNWQVPYDERLLEESAGQARYAFFFHYLDLGRPLMTPFGRIPLPGPTQIPPHLLGIRYEAP